MLLTTKTLPREFTLDGSKLADPNPALTVDEVRNFYSGTYPALNNAFYTEAVEGDRVRVTFKTAIGHKG